MALIEMEISVQSDIGIAPAELGRLQTLSVSLVVKLAEHFSDAAARSGQISQTLDYGTLRDIVHAVFSERRWDLLEQVSTVIRDRIGQLEPVESVRVGISKHYPWPDVAKLTLSR